jgi:hypothetical protein
VGSLEKFGLTKTVKINDAMNDLQIEATGHQFMAFITDKKDNITWTINQDGLVKQLNTHSNE